MAIAHSENVPSFRNDKRWPAAITSLAVGSGFFALWFWLLPSGSVSTWNWSAPHFGAGWL